MKTKLKIFLILTVLTTLAATAQAMQPEVLYSFIAINGANPYAKLVQGPDGNFYGTTSMGGVNGGYGTVFKLTTDGTLTTLVSLGGTNGATPYAGLTPGNDGNFYGTTYTGGTNGGFGTVFKVTANGTLNSLVSFASTNGAKPYAGLTLGNDGNFYGTTQYGGSGDGGTVFKVTTNGILTKLVNLGSGANPYAGLTLGSNGILYGTTYQGGSGNAGSVFKVTTNGTLTTLVSFHSGEGFLGHGSYPYGELLLGRDGLFYGTTSGGGTDNAGTVFKVTTNGIVTFLASFSSTNGDFPATGLTLGNDGNFYGTTFRGGDSSAGTVFRVATNGALTALFSFSYGNGANPNATLTLGNEGNLYGTTVGGDGTIFKVTTNGTLSSLFAFTNANGGFPFSGLTVGNDGNFYGTTYKGGTNGGYGTVFKLTNNGLLTTITSLGGSNGANPYAGLTLGNDDKFYGTTAQGGMNNRYGTIFEVTTNGTLTSLVSFDNTNGANPYAGLTLGNDGNFYGTTLQGGSSGGVGNGTVFRLMAGGTLTSLLSFSNASDAANPYGGLTLGSDGSFYGTTFNSGSGKIFKVTTNGTLTIWAAFGGTNGSLPHAGLTLGNDGNFYGTTTVSGTNGSYGTVFKVTTNGALTSLISLNGTNGMNPEAALMLGNDGNFYGTTESGGSSNYGTVFRVTINGTLSTLASFAFTNGAYPFSNLTLGSDGNVYGTTYQGGIGGLGVIYRLGNPPTIMVQPASRTNVFNTPATFSVSAVGGLPLSYQWFKSGVSLTDGGNVSGSGTTNLSLANVSPADATNYWVVVTNNYGSITSAVATLTVVQATPVITWVNPLPITYGTALSSTQLNASTNVPGSFVFMPPAGTVLNAGTNTLTAVFTPTDAVAYSSATGAVSLAVLPAPLAVTASNTSKLYGQVVAFAGTEFTASGLVGSDTVTEVTLISSGAGSGATVAGSPYTILPSAAIGSDLTNYNISYVNGFLTVTRASLSVTASNAFRAYGSPNPPFSGLINGIQNNDNITATYMTPATTNSPVGDYLIIPTLADPDGRLANYIVTYNNGTLTVGLLPPFVVVQLQLSPSGVSVRFNRAVDSSALNLFSPIGPANFTLIGSTSGPVAGSLIVGSQATNATFVKTGGLLAPDTYTITLWSATNGFKDLFGNLLDGNGDGAPGDNYVSQFTVAPFSARVLSTPDFARGPGQPVNVPASGTGIPISFSDGSNVLATSFTVEYDPALLHVTGATLGTNLPPGWTLNYNLSTPGFLPVSASGSTPLATGHVALATIQADIPWSAPYTRLGIINLTQAQANGGAIPVIGDSTVQVIAFLGDVDGDHAYTTNDALVIAQLAVQLISGFSSYPSADPVIIADVNGNGMIDIGDALAVSSMSLGLGAGGLIPDLPLPKLTTPSPSANNQLIISWPQGAEGYVLEQSGTLDIQSSWTPATNMPVISGGQQTVTITPTGNIQFYRLRK